MSVFPLLYELHGIPYNYRKLCRRPWITFVDNFVLVMFDFGGRWSMTLKNRGRLKKTQGWTAPKSRGGSLAVGTYLQRGSAPPPG